MKFYPRHDESVTWPLTIESGWHLLGGDCGSDLAPKLPHLGTSDVLFLAALLNLPKEQRPWGLVTWLSKVFTVSRPSLYALTNRVNSRLGEALHQTTKAFRPKRPPPAIKPRALNAEHNYHECA